MIADTFIHNYMRDFFKQELKTLKAKTGLNQYENISAMPDAQFQFKILLDSMELACNEFHYIPDNDKKRIIQEGIMRENEFTSLNSRVIWKWLNASKEHYWQVQQMKEEPTAHEPAPPEVAAKYAQQILDNIAKIGSVTTPQPREERFGATVSVGIKQTPTEEELLERELHKKYLLQNYEVTTGKKKECWMPENEWRELTKEID